jgi:hypothetical protein
MIFNRHKLQTKESHSKSYLLQTPTENNGIPKHIVTGESQNFLQKEEMSKLSQTNKDDKCFSAEVSPHLFQFLLTKTVIAKSFSCALPPLSFEEQRSNKMPFFLSSQMNLCNSKKYSLYSSLFPSNFPETYLSRLSISHLPQEFKTKCFEAKTSEINCFPSLDPTISPYLTFVDLQMNQLHLQKTLLSPNSIGRLTAVTVTSS